ncbi:hypothetical protein [Microbacterium sp. AK031]|uniref:hypothetical protein n=1 Tax=Microbacterium sp. AK031 TaxID=2723076 RepID=UPI002169FF28|nr:hypothetical protein [Microbacterium sp. AK031]MCS3844782.1 hypothetical protein [Microbacterium sp. AK031]
MSHINRKSAMSTSAKLSTTIAALVLGAAALTGCTATSEPQAADSSPTPTVNTTPEPAAAETTAAQDEVTCAAFGDVQTILLNTSVAFNEDRMGQQERSGWNALASRVLGNIPSADEGPVAEALAALKGEVPAVQGIDPTNIFLDEGTPAGQGVFEACEAAGFQVSVSGFTGG